MFDSRQDRPWAGPPRSCHDVRASRPSDYCVRADRATLGDPTLRPVGGYSAVETTRFSRVGIKVPRSTIVAVGIEPQYESDIRLGDGRTVTRSLALAEVEDQGVRRPVLVAIGANGEQPLIGCTTLEALDFKVSSVTHSLEPTPAIEY